ncbi:YigZ family protein [Schaalia hyovaginalis]|uniref:IMPACT family protein n=1 Tax=Schaalia hyovaginalis TaxID=29316 RepID=UPI0026EF9D4E|nr:YigZ family protein [Schaalia hyovaginalis]MCI6557093.1 IMPACT family protein [Schaalia hyovaginalis]MDD7554419.1 IMPACT family protein [Schaalia hyovaginalis]MDY3094105.1 YigZ family protein [Schaalia hyovaginalis]
MAPIDTIRSGTLIENEIEIKRSRFLTTLGRVDSVREARELIDLVKSQHPQARHNCSAYLVIEEGLNPQQHSSDDGEPSGTAGAPMLDALRLSGTWNVCAVVTRYFGGILLGGGGLIRAYSSSVSEALALAPRAHMRDLEVLSARLPLAEAGRIEAELRAAGATVLDVTWSDDVEVRIGVEPGRSAPFDSLVAACTQGVSHFRIVGTTRVEVDGPSPES